MFSLSLQKISSLLGLTVLSGFICLSMCIDFVITGIWLFQKEVLTMIYIFIKIRIVFFLCLDWFSVESKCKCKGRVHHSCVNKVMISSLQMFVIGQV